MFRSRAAIISARQTNLVSPPRRPSAVWNAPINNRRTIVRISAAGRTTAGRTTTEDRSYREKRFEAEFHMMTSRLGGVVQQAVAAAVLGRDTAGAEVMTSPLPAPPPPPPSPPADFFFLTSRAVPAPEVAQPRYRGVTTTPPWPPLPSPPLASKLPPATRSLMSVSMPVGMASAFLRFLDAQLQARKYESGGDEVGDVLGSFPSASLFHYPGGGLQVVLEHLAAASAEARGAAAPATAAVLRSLAGAVGRLAAQPNAEAARGKAAAVITCLDGMAEALEGATRGIAAVAAASVSAGAPTASASAMLPTSDVEVASAVAGLEAGQLLREVAAVLDCIAGGSPGLPAYHTASGHTLSPSAPAHPLLSAMETRLYGDSTWRSESAAAISCGLVDYLAALLSPSHAGNTSTAAGAVARGSVCAALHNLARAQSALAAALREHRVEPGVASGLFAALGEALAAARITRDAADPLRGPAPAHTFGEAQLLMGLSRMAAGEAITLAMAPGGAAAAASAAEAAVAADAAAGDSSLDRSVAIGSDASLVLEVLAEQAQQIAHTHCDSIARVLQDLREVPDGLGAVSKLPPAAAHLLHRMTAVGGTAAAAEAAASVAAANQGGISGVAGSTFPGAASRGRTGKVNGGVGSVA